MRNPNAPLTLRLLNHRCLSLIGSTTANSGLCEYVCILHTSYVKRGLQCHFRPADATANTLVRSRVPGLDLSDQHRAVGEQEHSAEKKQFILPLMLIQDLSPARSNKHVTFYLYMKTN